MRNVLLDLLLLQNSQITSCKQTKERGCLLHVATSMDLTPVTAAALHAGETQGTGVTHPPTGPKTRRSSVPHMLARLLVTQAAPGRFSGSPGQPLHPAPRQRDTPGRCAAAKEFQMGTVFSGGKEANWFAPKVGS